jgi:hypothetical protein
MNEPLFLLVFMDINNSIQYQVDSYRDNNRHSNHNTDNQKIHTTATGSV